MDAAFDMQPENTTRKRSPRQRLASSSTKTRSRVHTFSRYVAPNACIREPGSIFVLPSQRFPRWQKTAERRMAWLSGRNATFRKKTCIWKRQPRPKRKDPSFPRETRSWNIGEASKRSRPRQIGAGWKASRRLNRSKSARHCSMPRNPTGVISFDAGLTLTPV